MSRKLWMAEAEGFDPTAMQWLHDAGFEVETKRVDQAELPEVLESCDVFWFRLAYRLNAAALGARPRCRIVVDPVTGLTHIDEAACAEHGIQLLTLRGETEFLTEVRATAEHAFGLLLALARRTSGAHGHVLGGGWDRDLFAGRELYQKTLLVVGYGRLGAIVADYAKAFGMRVIAYDPYVSADQSGGSVGMCSDLEEALRDADYVSVHASVTDSSRGLIGANALRSLKDGALLINTARGVIVDEEAVATSLREGRLGGVAADVLADEANPAQSPLVRAAREGLNVLLTPHIGGRTPESFVKTERFMARKLIAHVEGAP